MSAFPVIEDAFTGEVHPHAAKFPMLSADDFESLCDSIARGGMRHAILIDQHGQLLDGRNRLRACQELGIEPRFEVVVTDDPEDEINAANVETKPLSTGQRAMARALALVAQEKRKDGRWEDGSAQSVGRKTAESEALRRCGYILDRNPMLANEVLGGDRRTTIRNLDANDLVRIIEVRQRNADKANAALLIAEDAVARLLAALGRYPSMDEALDDGALLTESEEFEAAS